MLPVLENAWLNIDKPEGYSSAKIVSVIKKITKANKVGHCGTLDPFATGVLGVALNKATKSSNYFVNSIKKYYFEISWGEFRDSDDITGKVIESSNLRPKTQEIIDILPKFIGKINQVPSKFSAIKINGQKSYDLARKGVDLIMKAREIEILQIKLISNNQQKASIEVICSKGTYIRSLAKDISIELMVCGYVSFLRRLEVGEFKASNSISLAKLKNIIKYDEVDNFLLQLRDVLNFIPEIELENLDASKIKNGQFVEIDLIKNNSSLNFQFLQSSSNAFAVKVINQGLLISIATLENKVLKPINNF